jgi:hypothetical protein
MAIRNEELKVGHLRAGQGGGGGGRAVSTWGRGGERRAARSRG